MDQIGPRLFVQNKEALQSLNFATTNRGNDTTVEETMPSVDLFHFLEWENPNIFRETRFYDYRNYEYGSYAAYHVTVANQDGSYSIGRGECNAAYLGNFYNVYSIQPQPAADCSLINRAIHNDIDGVLKVMKHSLQPSVKLGCPSELLHDFGPENVRKALLNSLRNRRTGPLLESDDPRILSCSDSVGHSLCNSLNRIYSSQGWSLAINMEDSLEQYLPEIVDSFSQHSFLQFNDSL